MGKAQKFKGNIPEDGEQIAENEDWVLYDKFKPSGSWQSLKLVSKKPITIKANYWFGWNGERFARCRDVVLLEEHRPDVYEWVVEVLNA